MSRFCYRLLLTGLGISLLCVHAVTHAERLNLTISDSSDKPVSNVVVSAYLENEDRVLPVAVDTTVIIDQIDKKFVNHVTPVQVGTAVSFPNHDQIRHHVYSFSPVKNFEIPLYKGIPAEPIIFKQEGIVSLGCNIHDWMSAYVVVIDSPYFGKTDHLGQASIYLPAGEYQLRLWHRDADEESKHLQQSISISSGEITDLPIEMGLKSNGFSGRSSISIFNRGRYR